MHRPTRHSLCTDKYVDSDFENCEANVLFECVSQYLIGHPEQSVDMSSLEKYCEKPKFYRDLLIEHYKVEDEVVSGGKSFTQKDKIKGLLIGLMNGGSQDKFRSHNKITIPDHAFVISFKQEIQNILTIVFKFNEHIVDAILKENPSHFEDKNTSGRAMSAVSLEQAKKRTCMAFFYQTIERKIQESAILAITTTHSVPVESIVPCQDGFMVLKEHYNERMLKTGMDAVKSTLGIQMKLLDKAFDEAFEIVPYEDKEMRAFTDQYPAEMFEISIPKDIYIAKSYRAFLESEFDAKKNDHTRPHLLRFLHSLFEHKKSMAISTSFNSCSEMSGYKFVQISRTSSFLSKPVLRESTKVSMHEQTTFSNSLSRRRPNNFGTVFVSCCAKTSTIWVLMTWLLRDPERRIFFTFFSMSFILCIYNYTEIRILAKRTL
jgi:hypothetical protein